ARCRRDIDRKTQAMGLELAVEIVEHDSWLDNARAVLDAEREHAVQVPGDVDNDAIIDGLPALPGAAAPWRDDAPAIARDREGPQRILHAARHHDASGHDLIKGRVRRIAAAAE